MALPAAQLAMNLCLAAYKFVAAIEEKANILSEHQRKIMPDCIALKELIQLIATTLQFKIDSLEVIQRLIQSAALKIAETARFLREPKGFDVSFERLAEGRLSAARQNLLLCVTISTNHVVITKGVGLATLAESTFRSNPVPWNWLDIREDTLDADVENFLMLHRYYRPNMFANKNLWILTPLYQNFFSRMWLLSTFSQEEQVLINRLCDKLVEYSRDPARRSAVAAHLQALLNANTITPKRRRPQFIQWTAKVRKRELTFLRAAGAGRFEEARNFVNQNVDLVPIFQDVFEELLG